MPTRLPNIDTRNAFSGDLDFCSNFYACPITVGVITYPTVEHAYQAHKARLWSSHVRIARARTPGEAKSLGRLVAMRDDWDTIKDGIMVALLRAKFAQVDMMSKLTNTGTLELVEYNSWGDTYWGVCRGQGLNKLGSMLMTLRHELRSHEKKARGV